MNSLQQYQFQAHQFRVIPDENGEPWFIAKDVFGILGYANHKDMAKKLCRPQGVSKRYIPELSNTYTLIDEGNLYRIIIKSNKPESERFESWVCDEILPSIRKTGAYQANGSIQAENQQLKNELLDLYRERQRLMDASKASQLKTGRWSDDELDQLYDLRATGLGAGRISMAMNRSYDAVRHQIRREGI
ncbi:MAG: BRO family protein [Methylicorpusculum sp.]|uniref:BRO-N domain-containing protein n=1 Tax=Methylicorpusculum sp. TaxID=2713644 RepID=UPI002718DC06|nr:BRO family protein [Methylicorpusculum sp.]MDO8940881.1 BRO family protein [Methylicorpusculum sp.]